MDVSDAQSSATRQDTFIIEPNTTHTHTFILLHGLGSNGERFGTEFLETAVCSTGTKLTERYPGAKFIFSTAKRRRSSAFRRAKLIQWFDIASLDDPSFRRDVQLHGLAESALQIRRILEQELVIIPSRNIILGGLSQGCAMALSILFSLGCPLGGFVGLSGWLPFRGDIEDLISGDKGVEDAEEEDIFAFSDGQDEEVVEPFIRAANYMKDLLSITRLGNSRSSSMETSLTTPVFLAHGEDDEKIKAVLGKEASKTISSIGFQTTWKSYPGLGHWDNHAEEIDDIFKFIESVFVDKTGGENQIV